MLDGLRQFIADVVSPEAQPGRAFDDNDYRLAATALLSMWSRSTASHPQRSSASCTA